MNRHATIIVAGVLLLITGARAAQIINYNGQLYESGAAVNGTRVFYFEMRTNNVVTWRSDSFVTQAVEYGYFTARLGDPAQMTPLPPGLFDEGADVYLRVAVGTTPATTNALSPDARIGNTGYSIDADKLSGLPAAQYRRLWTNVVIVAPGGRDGGGDFSTLAAAIADANARATANDPYTVLLLPGTYGGPGVTMPGANVHIAGLDRDNCIITSTLTINQNTLVQNLTFTLASGYGINIQGGAPTLQHIKINGGTRAIYAQSGSGATLCDIEAYDGSGPALYDEIGCLLDGLRVTNRMAFVLNLSATTGIYKNIRHESTAGGVGNINNGASALIRSLKGTGTLTVNWGNNVRLRDVRIACNLTCVDIVQIQSLFELHDGDLQSSGSSAAQVNMNGFDGPVRFDDVRFATVEQSALNLQLASQVTLKECDLYVAGTGNGINCDALSELYVQTSRIRTLGFGIFNAPADTWVYDTTIRSGMASMQGTLGTPPRIADCRLNTDTQPMQTTPWNAFGNPGAGNPEDANGNIVAPMMGTPVTP